MRTRLTIWLTALTEIRSAELPPRTHELYLLLLDKFYCGLPQSYELQSSPAFLHGTFPE